MNTDVEVIPKENSKALSVTTTVAGFVTAADLVSQLRAEYNGVTYDVTTPLGMAKAVEARRKFRTGRVALDKAKPEVKREALDYCNKVEADYKLIRAAFLEYEEVADNAIKAEETRKEEERAEKARIAAAAQKVLDDKILEIGKLPMRCIGKNTEEIGLFLARLEAREIGGEFTGETRERAEAAKAEAIETIRTAHAEAIEREAEAARQEKENKERERVANIRKRIESLQSVFVTPSMTSADVEALVETCKAKPITVEEFQEFFEEAFAANQKTITALCAIHGETVEREERDAQLKADQEKLAADRLTFQKEQDAINAARAEEDRIAREKREAEAAEEKRKQDELIAKQREEERQAASVAEQNRVAAEKERKMAEKKAKLLAAKCKDAATAFKNILAICQDKSISPAEGIEQISIIAEGNLE